MQELQAHRSQEAFRRGLLSWYYANRRALPWRGETDPYRIWVSEIMLQQTRVAAVKDRYRSFLKRFPNEWALARAPINLVLAEWSGLGYYRRARNMHAAVRLLARQRRSIPQRADELRTLPGIGRYTSAAIASIAFGESIAAVDGNVERVLSRITGMSPRNGGVSERTWQIARELVDPQNPGDFNQAMMELGATVCLPRKPACPKCPVSRFCVSMHRAAGRSELRKKTRQTVREKYILHTRPGSILLVRRPARASVMPGMLELPRTSSRLVSPPLLRLRHSITTRDHLITVVSAPRRWRPPQSSVWKRLGELQSLPLTGLTRKVLLQALPGAALKLK